MKTSYLLQKIMKSPILKKKSFYINIYNDAQSLMKFKCLKNIIENKKGYCNVAVRTFSDENHKKINMLLAVFC